MTARCHLSSVGCKPHDSFTILELLVASAVTVLIAGVVLSLSSSVLRNWGRSHGALTAEGQARAALDRLSLDLCGALYCDDGNVWLAVTVQPEASVSGLGANGTKPVGPSLNPAASNLMDARFGVASVWLRFFTVAQGTDPRSNDPAATVAVS